MQDVCLCVCMIICVCACVCACVRVRMRKNVCMHMCIIVCMYAEQDKHRPPCMKSLWVTPVTHADRPFPMSVHSSAWWTWQAASVWGKRGPRLSSSR